jgi:hypothetical protein
MANEILPSGVADLSLAETLAAEFLLLASDREDLVLQHPALYKVGALPGSNVVSVPHVGLMGYDLAATATPGSEIANTALTDGSSSITMVKKAKRYNEDDLARFMIGGVVNAQMFAQDALITIQQTLISLAAVAGSGFSASVGSTGVNLTWATFLAAKAVLLNNAASGQPVAILHPQQWADLEADALSVGVTADPMILSGALTANLGSYKGRWFGVDVFTSQHVPSANAGADREGCMFVRGGVVLAHAAPAVENVAAGVVQFGDMGIFEISRKAEYGATNYITSFFAGAAVGVDALGVSILSDL